MTMNAIVAASAKILATLAGRGDSFEAAITMKFIQSEIVEEVGRMMVLYDMLEAGIRVRMRRSRRSRRPRAEPCSTGAQRKTPSAVPARVVGQQHLRF